MFTRSSKWNVKSIILVSLIGIIMGLSTPMVSTMCITWLS